MKAIKCIISGKVQGVGFRWSTRRKASKLNIKGHAKNLADGTVEVIAYGENQNINKLKQWLVEEGPRMARIDDVSCQSVELKQTPSRFKTL